MNIFILVKRLTTDLKRLEELTKSSSDFIQRIAYLLNSSAYPTKMCLQEAAVALMDMQEKQIFNICHRNKMTAEDCFELGRQIYETERFSHNHSVLWLNEALDRLAKEEIPSVPEVDIL